ncbi:MAG: 7-cyano-7-deazaguanine synthase QueC [Pseudomonadota bacterium]|nr:7-cyano-7-deazaguanine synthase QueC [Pseudomonadota bacterium]
MPKAIVLLSGGLDSATCLAYAKVRGFELYALTFSYGQRHKSELNASRRIAQHFQVVEQKIVEMNYLSEIKGSALTDKGQSIPRPSQTNQIPSTYVPARNTIFLSHALAWAEVLKCQHIFIGCSQVDYSGYPDCRKPFIETFNILANQATKLASEGYPIQIHAPLIDKSKAETIELGHELGVDYKMTVSCYQANAQGLACGQCESCYLRQKGFQEANLADETRYVH